MKRIFLYDDRRGDLPDFKELRGYLDGLLPPVKTEIRMAGFPISLAGRFLSAKVQDVNKQVEPSADFKGSFLPLELEYEIERLKDPDKKSFGVIYDGFEFLKIFRDLIPAGENNPECFHVAFTNRLLGTFSDDDKRYHLRSGIYSLGAAAVSVTGIVEAPARPRGYYLKKTAGASEQDLTKEFGGKFIDYGDRKITEVCKGLVMQAVFYHLTGESFCGDKKCRLYNAHWQEELIASQINNKQEFCNKHKKMIFKM